MADTSEGFNFSIEDTMNRGAGDAQLLTDLMSSESATTDPEDVKKIIKTVEDDPIEKKDTKLRGKDIVPKDNDKEEKTGQDLISDFLGDHENDDDDDEDKDKGKDTTNDDDDILQKKEENDEEDDEASQLAVLANDLKRLGVFSDLDEGEEEIEIKSPQDFLERFKVEKQKGALEIVDKFLGQFGEDYKNAFEAIYVKGADPKEYFSTYNTITDFAKLDMSKEENQILVVRQALIDQEFDSEDIEAEVEKLKNYGDLEATSNRYHKGLIKKGALKLQQIEQKAEQELKQKIAIRNQYIHNVEVTIQDKLKTKEFDGIPINPKLASELQDFLLTEGWVTTSGEKLTGFDKAILDLKKPENHSHKVKIALILKILEKDPSLKTIQSAGVSKKTDKLFEVLTKEKPVKKSTDNRGSSSWFVK